VSGAAEVKMRIGIIGGSSEDERHLGRLSEKLGHVTLSRVPESGVAVARPAPAQGDGSCADGSPLLISIERMHIEALDESSPAATLPSVPGAAHTGPLALVFEVTERIDVAVRLLHAVRRDPYFERVGTLLVLPAQQARSVLLPGGFDDFMLSPCSIDELSIRIAAVTRRRGSFIPLSAVDGSGVVVDEPSRAVIVDGHAVQLTAREFALFTYLCEWRGKVLSREHLLARVWGSRYSGGRRTVDIHVRRLRAKLGASLAIETLRGSGYRLKQDSLGPESSQMPEPFSKVS
jgi:DNA-binding winged helix-turn-helix (wHTH) protein